MALSAYAGSLTAPASTGSQSYTGVGFQPKAVLFWSTGATADGSSGTVSWCVGGATSSSSRFAIDINVSGRHDNTKCVYINVSPNSAIADFVSMDADGFTLNWTSISGASGMVVTYLALGGADLTNVAIKQFTTPTSTGNSAVTGVGFQPDAVLCFGMTALSTAPPANTAAIQPLDQSWFTSSAQGALSFLATNVSTFNGYQRTSSAFAALSGSSVVREASYVSMDSDGFTLNWSSVSASARYIWAVCLKGGQYKVGSFDKPTSTGNSAVTGVGFTPTAEVFLSFGIAAQTTVSTSARAARGWATGTSNRSSIAGSFEGTTANLMYLTRTAALRIDADGTALGEADFVSHDADGFTLNWSTADGTARQVLYFAAGSTPPPATPDASLLALLLQDADALGDVLWYLEDDPTLDPNPLVGTAFAFETLGFLPDPEPPVEEHEREDERGDWSANLISTPVDPDPSLLAVPILADIEPQDEDREREDERGDWQSVEITLPSLPDALGSVAALADVEPHDEDREREDERGDWNALLTGTPADPDPSLLALPVLADVEPHDEDREREDERGDWGQQLAPPETVVELLAQAVLAAVKPDLSDYEREDERSDWQVWEIDAPLTVVEALLAAAGYVAIDPDPLDEPPEPPAEPITQVRYWIPVDVATGRVVLYSGMARPGTLPSGTAGARVWLAPGTARGANPLPPGTSLGDTPPPSGTSQGRSPV